MFIFLTSNAMFHEPEISQFLNVGHVSDSGLGVDSDHVAALALLDEVKHNILANPEKKEFV